VKRKREGNKFRDKENLSLERANGVMVVGWGSEVKKKTTQLRKEWWDQWKSFLQFYKKWRKSPTRKEWSSKRSKYSEKQKERVASQRNRDRAQTT